MDKIINIERTGTSYLKIEELEEILQLVTNNPNETLLINKELLTNILENAIDDYWSIKVSGEYE